ncbi:DsbA family protein [Motilimonas pumila]|uniref:DsbA family protein n=1 Tax=Motilimonas pumila TaxID=2303987 RepID=A0A418YFF9_9GAMM|nr:DsbA family protein [Motilimonas pumila]RJG47936.1 DsbA family protein [Motilimonas pumila]
MNKLIYIADPMCSWCFGFAPELAKLQAAVAGKLQLELVMGGLRTGADAQALTPEFAQELAHHWQKVTATTEQSFNHDFLNQTNGFIYDTEPACRAVTLMGEAKPEHQLAYLFALQQGFYQQKLDITQPQVLADIANEWLDQSFFADLFDSEAIIEATKQDFEMSRMWQVFSYPTLVYSTGERMIMLSQGYAKCDAILEGIANIEAQLTQQPDDFEQ